MAGLLLRRAGFSLLSLLLVSACLFLLTRSIPDSPARIVLGQDATEAQAMQFEREHGLDRSVSVQYARWVTGIIARGDLGRSFITGRAVGGEIARTLAVTLGLVVIAFSFACVLSIVTG